MSRFPDSSRTQSGFTLIEIVVSLTVLSVVIAGFLAVLAASVRVVGIARRDLIAALVLNDAVERAREVCPPPGNVETALNGIRSRVVIQSEVRAGYGRRMAVNIQSTARARNLSSTTALGNCNR